MPLSEICINKTQQHMTFASVMKGNSKEVGNINMSGRVKQIFVLFVAILIGMIISMATADAKDFQHENQKKYKKQTVLMANACHLLKVKRATSTNKMVKETTKLKYR
jgi:Na+-transporting NADH:ubiquinone oxidoreductase subunit NqrC